MPNYEQAIKKGKEWMKLANNRDHGYTHAENVAAVSVEILEELKRRNYPGANSMPRELMEATAWWHDCYISTTTEETFSDIFTEGRRSSRIIEKELSGILSKQDIKVISRAVRRHVMPGILFYFASSRLFAPLEICLMEADAVELMTEGRLGNIAMKGLAGKGANHFFRRLKRVWYFLSRRYFRSQAAKQRFIAQQG